MTARMNVAQMEAAQTEVLQMIAAYDAGVVTSPKLAKRHSFIRHWMYSNGTFAPLSWALGYLPTDEFNLLNSQRYVQRLGWVVDTAMQRQLAIALADALGRKPNSRAQIYSHRAAPTVDLAKVHMVLDAMRDFNIAEKAAVIAAIA